MFPLRLPGAMPLGLLATLITACPAPSSPSPAPAPTTPTAPPVAPDWLDPLAEITLTLPGSGWTKKTSEEVGGTVGVTLTNQRDCRGRLWRTRVPPQAAADRQAALDARIDFVKTSTGFGPAGASLEAVKLMRTIVGERLGVKASGGIRTADEALAHHTMYGVAPVAESAAWKARAIDAAERSDANAIGAGAALVLGAAATGVAVWMWMDDAPVTLAPTFDGGRPSGVRLAFALP